MVGLKIHKIKCAHSIEFNEYRVHITLDEISDEGLDLFGLTEDDAQS